MPSGVGGWFRHAAVSLAGPSLDIEESRALLQERIALFGKVGSAFVFGAVFFVLLASTLGPSSARVWVPMAGAASSEVTFSLATASVLGAAWLLCRRRRRSPEALLLRGRI